MLGKRCSVGTQQPRSKRNVMFIISFHVPPFFIRMWRGSQDAPLCDASSCGSSEGKRMQLEQEFLSGQKAMLSDRERPNEIVDHMDGKRRYARKTAPAVPTITTGSAEVMVSTVDEAIGFASSITLVVKQSSLPVLLLALQLAKQHLCQASKDNLVLGNSKSSGFIRRCKERQERDGWVSAGGLCDEKLTAEKCHGVSSQTRLLLSLARVYRVVLVAPIVRWVWAVLASVAVPWLEGSHWLCGLVGFVLHVPSLAAPLAGVSRLFLLFGGSRKSLWFLLFGQLLCPLWFKSIIFGTGPPCD
ncbi:hypothetical protein SADUNF_Sadunf15G0046000 [Salix dunnii]|uniref:Uncharacterized protein n=1 Tax=Salix dunnii TaxID=1413687 RepID=A0A835JAK9_9ROSI|nr:hypothetical protein SADUNF_Sadunf15G0046000 [Salix dunnii]